MINAYLNPIPVVAILRGLTPENAVNVAKALYETGVRAIEVPMNSPRPIESIRLIRNALAEDCAVGAGTVTSLEQCKAVLGTGSTLIVSPHVDTDIISYTVNNGGVSLPGVFTPTEAFAAHAAGASGLKLFPASSGGVRHYKALQAVLPKELPVLAVGGISKNNICDWLDAGVDGLGVGSAIFKPNWAPEKVYSESKLLTRLILETQ